MVCGRFAVFACLLVHFIIYLFVASLILVFNLLLVASLILEGKTDGYQLIDRMEILHHTEKATERRKEGGKRRREKEKKTGEREKRKKKSRMKLI